MPKQKDIYQLCSFFEIINDSEEVEEKCSGQSCVHFTQHSPVPTSSATIVEYKTRTPILVQFIIFTCVCVCVALGFYNVWLCVNTITIKIQSCSTTTGSPVLQLCITLSGTSQTQEYIMNDSMYIMNKNRSHYTIEFQIMFTLQGVVAGRE